MISSRTSCALELDVGEPGLAEQLAEQRDRRRDVIGLEGHLEQRVVAAGLGVEGRPEPLDGGVEGQRGRVALGAPEQHVLDEVGQPVVLGRLEPRADLDEQGADGRVEVGQRDGGHRQPVVEGGGRHGRIEVHAVRLTTCDHTFH